MGVKYAKKNCDFGKLVDECLRMNPAKRPKIDKVLENTVFNQVTRRLEDGLAPTEIMNRLEKKRNPKEEEISDELRKFLETKRFHQSEGSRIDKLTEELRQRLQKLEGTVHKIIFFFKKLSIF